MHKTIHKTACLQLLTKSIMSETPRVPQYSAFTIVKRNIITPDDDILRYLPYLAEANSSQTKEDVLRELYGAYSEKHNKCGRAFEKQELLRGYLDTWLKDIDHGIDETRLVQYIMTLDNWDVDMKRKYIDALQADNPANLKSCQHFAIAFQEVFQHRLADVVLGRKGTIDKLVEEAKQMLQKSKQSKGSDMASNNNMNGTSGSGVVKRDPYNSSSCLICGTFYCLTHGDYKEEDIVPSDDSDADTDKPGKVETESSLKPVVLGYDDLHRKHNIRTATLQQGKSEPSSVAAEPCSGECYLVHDWIKLRTFELTAEQHATIQTMLYSLADSVNRPCSISYLLDLPCWQVDNQIRTKITHRNFKLPQNHIRTKKLDWYDNKKKILKRSYSEETLAHHHEKRVQVHPVRMFFCQVCYCVNKTNILSAVIPDHAIINVLALS